MGREYDGLEQENGYQIAMRMIKQGGLSDETIAMISGLSLEDLEEIRKEIEEEE